VLALLDEMQEVPDEKGVRIIETNRTTLDHKKQLLADQLSEVSQETYSADTIFSLNTKYGLSDQE
jgi:hypothetical protein